MGLKYFIGQWHETISLAVAGFLGGVVSIPSIEAKGRFYKIFYLASGIVSAYYLAPIVTSYFNIGISPAGFLCGSFAGSIISKIIELVKSIKLQDIINNFIFRR